MCQKCDPALTRDVVVGTFFRFLSVETLLVLTSLGPRNLLGSPVVTLGKGGNAIDRPMLGEKATGPWSCRGTEVAFAF